MHCKFGGKYCPLSFSEIHIVFFFLYFINDNRLVLLWKLIQKFCVRNVYK